MSKTQGIRVAIVGMGIRGRMYAATCGGLTGAELVGACDLADEVRSAAESEFGIEAFADVAEMCQRARPDAVVIATPDFAHTAPALAAADAGCHLLIEKPLAMTVTEAKQIVAAVESAGAEGMVAFENHWNPPCSAAKAAADAGELGEIVSITSQLDDRIDVPAKLLRWLGKSSPGWFLLAHTVELAGWIADQKPARVFATGVKGVLTGMGLDTYDAIHATIDFDGGAAGTFNSCWVLPESLPLIFQFRHEMVGTKGSVRIDLTDQMLRKATAAGYEHPSTIGVTMTGALTSPPAMMFADFIAAIAGGEPVPCPLADGLLNVAAVAAIHESIESGEPVEVTV